jgi:hypothetical protein
MNISGSSNSLCNQQRSCHRPNQTTTNLNGKTMSHFNQKAVLALLAVTSLTGSLSIPSASAGSHHAQLQAPAIALTQVKPRVPRVKPAGAVTDVILWDVRIGTGTSFESNKGVADLSTVGFDKKASSIQVTNGQKWRFYKEKNFQGQFIEIGPNEARGSIGNFDNQISSFKSVK